MEMGITLLLTGCDYSDLPPVKHIQGCRCHYNERWYIMFGAYILSMLMCNQVTPVSWYVPNICFVNAAPQFQRSVCSRISSHGWDYISTKLVKYP